MAKKLQTLDAFDPAAKEAMSWYGWGSPVGLGIALISIGLTLWLLQLANIIK